MSTNRNRKGRRSYLKHAVSKHTVDKIAAETMGIVKNVDPTRPEPWRKQVNKHSPTLTAPMAEKLLKHNPSHFGLHIKPDPWHMVVCVNSALTRIEMFFNGFNDRAVYYFRWEDKLSNVIRESHTITKDTAMRIRANRLRGIPWK